MTHSGNFGKSFGNGEVGGTEVLGLFVKNGLKEFVVDLGVNLGVNLGNDKKESAEDADDFAEGDIEFELCDIEFELFERDVGLLQTVIGDNRCLKSKS